MGDEKETSTDEKMNAWAWFFSNFAILAGIAIVFIIAGVTVVKDLVSSVIAIMLGATVLLCLATYTPKWYRQLVKGNYIKTFADSSFWEIFKA